MASRWHFLGFMPAICLATTAAIAQDRADVPRLESYPDHVLARIERQAKAAGEDLQGFFRGDKLWEKKSTVRVAFLGGSDELCEQIAAVADRWTKHGNLKFSFRDDGKIRRWSPRDQDYVAEIRVAFSERGLWSLIGKDSTNPKIAGPSQQTMNLEDFDKGFPADWDGTVLHEFGHAIGLLHEHQRPLDGCDFRFDDDPGYMLTLDKQDQATIDKDKRRPGLITRLGSAPNYWSEATVRANLEKISSSQAHVGKQPFDRQSIMLYDFPAWMFYAGEKSRCYIGRRNNDLSDGDKAIMGIAYGR